jgi:prephenate dehydratase
MGRTRIAIQGEPGSFSDEAARKLLGSAVTILPCATFRAAFAALGGRRVHACVIPIENTLAGSVHENYDLLLEHRYWVEAELKMRIRHMLIARPGVTLRQVRQVYSHPVALAQCRNFFERHRWLEPVAAYDTAGSVKQIVGQRGNEAAIAGRAAAAAYGARILARNIEDDPGNFTRFLLVTRKRRIRPGATKTSLVFATKNAPGALHRSLAPFALRNVNLTKIESRPWRTRPWEYLFYLDFLGRPDAGPGREALAALGRTASLLRVLGCYTSRTAS